MCLGLLNTLSVHLWLQIHTSFHFLCAHTLKPVSDQQCSVQRDTPTGSPPEGEAVMRNYWYKMVREFQNTHTRKRPLKHPPLLWHLHCVYSDCVAVKRLSGKSIRRFAGYRWTRRSGARQEHTSIFVVSSYPATALSKVWPGVRG